MPSDPSGIITAILTHLRAQSDLTDLLAERPRTGTKAKSILYGGEAIDSRSLPCITLRDLGYQPAVGAVFHEHPMRLIDLALEISLWGEEHLLRPIAAQVDYILERAVGASQMADTSAWGFHDINTAGSWVAVPVPQNLLNDASSDSVTQTGIEQRAKTYTVRAADRS